MNRIKFLAAAMGLALAAGITTAGQVVINDKVVGTYDSYTITSQGSEGTVDITSSDIDPNNLGSGTEDGTPTASFTFECTDLTCSFDGSGSSDSDGVISDYSWNFGDGTTGVEGVTPQHTYESDGNYSVTLTVSDGTNNDSLTRSVSVGSGGGGTVPPECSGVGIGSNGWVRDTTPSSFTSFPPPTGDTTVYSINRNEYNAIEFTASTGINTMVNFDENTATDNGIVTLAVSRCPGDFEQEVPNSNCRRESNVVSMYMGSSDTDPASWECPLQVDETYYLNIAFGSGVGNNLSNTCESSRCGGVYTFYNK